MVLEKLEQDERVERPRLNLEKSNPTVILHFIVHTNRIERFRHLIGGADHSNANSLERGRTNRTFLHAIGQTCKEHAPPWPPHFYVIILPCAPGKIMPVVL